MTTLDLNEKRSCVNCGYSEPWVEGVRAGVTCTQGWKDIPFDVAACCTCGCWIEKDDVHDN